MKDQVLKPTATLYDAVKAIDKTIKKIAVVVSDDGLLQGTVTDGDIRRCILAGGTLEKGVTFAMNKSPLTALLNTSSSFIVNQLKRNILTAMPIVDDDGHFVKIIHISELLSKADHEAIQKTFDAGVIMAGGEGTRLRPLTDDIPKPMVDIGGLPLLERQISKLEKAGIKRIYISVNYLSKIIENHFGNGSDFGVKIKYLRENKKLGTAGALSLLPEKEEGTLLVMNGDVLSTYDLTNLYNFHLEHESLITVGAVDYSVEIPFGVIQSDGVNVLGLKEKPSQRYLCNAGIYAISKKILGKIPDNSFYNMTDLIQSCLDHKEMVAVFPVHEYWMDIGTPKDLEEARKEFENMTINYE